MVCYRQAARMIGWVVPIAAVASLAPSPCRGPLANRTARA